VHSGPAFCEAVRDVGIVGLPYSGKSTLFRALTRTGSAGGRSNQAVVDVPDPRLEVLARLERSAKVVPAKLRFVDAPGGITARALGEHRQTDALCVVLRAFGGDGDPAAELATLTAEFMLADLASIESGLEKARKRAKGSTEGLEVRALEAARSALEEECPLRDARLDADALRLLRGYGLLTLKPWIVVANAPEEGFGGMLPKGALVISAALEAEVAGLDPADAAELLDGFGVSEPGLDKVIAACYRALDLVTFLTTGTDESRAWHVTRGASAPEAAGAIHSDLQRGFIRAEVVSYEDLVAAGSWDQAKSRGRVRTEGKNYVVAEGDVVSVRFAV
jgi:GTP-binding protein YchF